jgi:putative glutamine amidotransferase
VAISQRVDLVESRGEKRDAIDQRLARWVQCAGFLPVHVPNTMLALGGDTGLLDDWLRRVAPDAIVLSGGNDLGQYPDRDATELHLLQWAEQSEIPLLGLCRGMQLMAVRAGVDLVAATGHVGTHHTLVVEGRPDLWPTKVNSYHNWSLGGCPAGFEVAARAQPDNTIEAIRHSTLRWEAWMWHPERGRSFVTQDINRLKRIIDGPV